MFQYVFQNDSVIFLSVFAVQTLGEIALGWKRKEELIFMVKSSLRFTHPVRGILMGTTVISCSTTITAAAYHHIIH